MRKFLMLSVMLVFVMLSSSYAGNSKSTTVNMEGQMMFANLRSNARLLTNFLHSEHPSTIINKEARRQFIMQRLKQYAMMRKLKSNAAIFNQFSNLNSAESGYGPSYHEWDLASDADTSLFNHQLNVLSAGYYQMVSSMNSVPLPSPYHNTMQVIGVAFFAYGDNADDDLGGNYETNPGYPLLNKTIPDNSTASMYLPYVDWSKFTDVGFEWYMQYNDDLSYDDHYWYLEPPFTGHP